ncbi:zinc-dependent alcohol dehydrogenase family protein (plasmid) [Embleya sp. NBC_00888]|uniref:zinc-dependent alcohol dehydrogenase family protein n=1 Tax=Embleya sp. NBC_00888 TaxID=2975960 RepID=UPI002F90D5A3|nr:zinc-dependent alcohol dehydrogenase family protein [Embleya sp. NBC_00888]
MSVDTSPTGRRTGRSWVVTHPGPIDTRPLAVVEREPAQPGPGEILVRVEACGVCRTDLHLAEGDLAPHRANTVPGHEVVGEVEFVGAGSTRFVPGDRVGIAWLRHTCGRCRYCRAGAENLCPDSTYTGWDADGGFADRALVPEDYAYALPVGRDAEHLAPLLCAGIIGYRALLRADLPPGGRLGIYGFGASAHLAAQVALARGASVHVMTRSEQARRLALELGAASAGDTYAPPPEPLDAAIVFAPVGEVVPAALAALDRSGTVAVAGIHLSDIPPLNYQRHLFHERNLRSVTANTRRDGVEFLRLATEIDLQVTTTRYPMSRADQALADLAADRVRGAAVLIAD